VDASRPDSQMPENLLESTRFWLASGGGGIRTLVGPKWPETVFETVWRDLFRESGIRGQFPTHGLRGEGVPP
jgi:hypothetical protein